MRLNREIICADDEGNRYTVQEWQRMRELRPLNGPVQKVPGMKSLRTTSGLHVNYIDENTFEIVETDTTIRRV